MLQIPALVAHAANLDLVIRHVLAGLGHGIHAGRERGAGVEFSEYRAYAPGDEWRRVDWKLLARADRYFVREAERDSHVAVWLWPGADQAGGAGLFEALLNATAAPVRLGVSRPHADPGAVGAALREAAQALAHAGPRGSATFTQPDPLRPLVG